MRRVGSGALGARQQGRTLETKGAKHGDGLRIRSGQAESGIDRASSLHHAREGEAFSWGEEGAR